MKWTIIHPSRGRCQKAFDALKLPYDKTEKTGAPSFTRNLPMKN